MSITETRKGELYIFGEAALWAFFPIITILSYSLLSPIASLAWSSIFLLVFFACLIAARRNIGEIFKPVVWKYIPLITLFITVLYYGLYFTGLKYTTADNASIIALMELFFSYVFFNLWKKEFFSSAQTFGGVLMLLSALIVVFPKHGLSFRGGDLLILAATACAPVGNYYQQKLRQSVSSETIVFLRSLAAVPIFFVLAFLLKTGAPLAAVGKSFWLLALNGIFILGLSKLMWMEGIHRISVTKANALSVVAPLLTLFFSFWILHERPEVWQALSLIPMFFGVLLLTKSDNLKDRVS